MRSACLHFKREACALRMIKIFIFINWITNLQYTRQYFLFTHTSKKYADLRQMKITLIKLCLKWKAQAHDTNLYFLEVVIPNLGDFTFFSYSKWDAPQVYAAQDLLQLVVLREAQKQATQLGSSPPSAVLSRSIWHPLILLGWPQTTPCHDFLSLCPASLFMTLLPHKPPVSAPCYLVLSLALSHSIYVLILLRLPKTLGTLAAPFLLGL